MIHGRTDWRDVLLLNYITLSQRQSHQQTFSRLPTSIITTIVDDYMMTRDWNISWIVTTWRNSLWYRCCSGPMDKNNTIPRQCLWCSAVIMAEPLREFTWFMPVCVEIHNGCWCLKISKNVVPFRWIISKKDCVWGTVQCTVHSTMRLSIAAWSIYSCCCRPGRLIYHLTYLILELIFFYCYHIWRNFHQKTGLRYTFILWQFNI